MDSKKKKAVRDMNGKKNGAGNLNVPEKLADFISDNPLNQKDTLLQEALILYPYILNEEISHGYAAELLGMNRLSLISLYESIGIPFHRISKEELENEITLFNKLESEATE